MKKWTLTAALALASLFNYAQQALLIRAGKFYDSEAGVFLYNQDILIEGSKISRVGKNIPAPTGAQVISLPNATVAPGLIDAHTHLLTLQQPGVNLALDAMLNSPEQRVLRAAGAAKSYLQAGYTAVRDLGNSGYYLDVELRRGINSGYVDGPRIFASGPILSAMDGQFYQLPMKDQQRITESEYRVIRGVEDARQAVLEHANNFTDVIKIVTYGERLGLSREELKAIVETAHANRLKVTAHANFDYVIRESVLAGVDGIEHAYYLEDSTLDLIKSRGVYIVPTDPSVSAYVRGYEVQNIKDYKLDDIRKELKPLQERLMRAHKKSVMIVAGSDAYIDLKQPRGDMAKETLIAYLESGLTPAEVMKTTTWNAALALDRKDQLGVIKQGALADLVIFNGDLEKDFKKTVFDVKMTIKNGAVVYSK